jgi:hypothetical protein
MDLKIAYCGLTCAYCPSYLITQTNDKDMIEKYVIKARNMYSPNGTAESLACDGCLSQDDERLYEHCVKCEIRACGKTRGVVNCAHCADYACSKLEEFFKTVPEARTTLDTVKQSL